MYEIIADELVIGRNVVIETGVLIQGKSSNKAKRVVIGDNVFIGTNSKIYVDELSIGDYTIIHNHAFIAGEKPCRIGHCCWFGQNTIFNSTGGLEIGNGVGIGAYSQLWSHISHGDILQGCQFNSSKKLILDDDVWFVGHCIVSPIHAHEKSMALVGSVVTKDMLPNHVYAGVPAKDITNKLGPQFEEVPLEKKYSLMKTKLEEFYQIYPECKEGNIRIVRSMEEAASEDISQEEATIFDVSTRVYNRRRTCEEYEFMKHLLQLIKFFPVDSHTQLEGSQKD